MRPDATRPSAHGFRPCGWFGAVAIAALPALRVARRRAGDARGSTSRTAIRPGPSSSAEVSQAPSGKTVNARVYLSPRNEAALDAAVAAVSTPGSAELPALHHARRNSGSSTARRRRPRQRSSSWLRSAGLKVSGVAAERPLFHRHGFGEKRAEGVRHEAVAVPPRRRHVSGAGRAGDGAEQRGPLRPVRHRPRRGARDGLARRRRRICCPARPKARQQAGAVGLPARLPRRPAVQRPSGES